MIRDRVALSVIVPVYNGGKFLDNCLNALKSSSFKSYELIVVDDGSTDDSFEISRRQGATVLRMARQSGPAAARNFGAEKARAEILCFIDADVLVHRDSLARIVADFKEHPEIAAVFGSYDQYPAERNFLSQYKNLYHHFIHQRGSRDASTFWAGCGAIRRKAFNAVGGFDDKLYSKPCVEDIELGYRMRTAGYRILLDRDLQCKHLKLWKLWSLLRADIFYRAIPWSKLIIERRGMINDLNLQTSERASAALVCLSLLILPVSFFVPQILLGLLLVLPILLLLNHKLYWFLYRLKGPAFVVLAFQMQLLHYFYSSASFALCWIRHLFIARPRASDLQMTHVRRSST